MRTPRIVFNSDRSIAKLRALVAFVTLVTVVGINTFPSAAAAVDHLSAFTCAVPSSITDQIQDLIKLVGSFGLPRRPENSLITTKLDNAVAAGEASDTAIVGDSITAFINECLAQSGKKLTPEQCTELINLANQIKSSLGCP